MRERRKRNDKYAESRTREREREREREEDNSRRATESQISGPWVWRKVVLASECFAGFACYCRFEP